MEDGRKPYKWLQARLLQSKYRPYNGLNDCVYICVLMWVPETELRVIWLTTNMLLLRHSHTHTHTQPLIIRSRLHMTYLNLVCQCNFSMTYESIFSACNLNLHQHFDRFIGTVFRIRTVIYGNICGWWMAFQIRMKNILQVGAQDL